jgi:hypothetical protein
MRHGNPCGTDTADCIGSRWCDPRQPSSQELRGRPRGGGRTALTSRVVGWPKPPQLCRGGGEWRIPRPHTYSQVGRPCPSPECPARPRSPPPKNQPTNRCHHGRRARRLIGEERDGRRFRARRRDRRARRPAAGAAIRNLQFEQFVPVRDRCATFHSAIAGTVLAVALAPFGRKTEADRRDEGGGAQRPAHRTRVEIVKEPDFVSPPEDGLSRRAPAAS